MDCYEDVRRLKTCLAWSGKRVCFGAVKLDKRQRRSMATSPTKESRHNERREAAAQLMERGLISVGDN
jgi:hypothetical protein